jgi:hypothetical protein
VIFVRGHGRLHAVGLVLSASSQYAAFFFCYLVLAHSCPWFHVGSVCFEGNSVTFLSIVRRKRNGLDNGYGYFCLVKLSLVVLR